MRQFLELFLHLDVVLGSIIVSYGVWSYAFLFLVVFIETGVVIMPFLPGDSLLFAAGTFSGLGNLNLLTCYLVLAAAAVLGDTINYWIGRRLGEAVTRGGTFLGIKIKKSYLLETQIFFDRFGHKAIILGRFLPIIRTFVPFVAGIGQMNYSIFLFYNLLGGLIWVALFVTAGYFFGTIQVVRDNFELVVLGIIGLSLLPTVLEFVKWKRKK